MKKFLKNPWVITIGSTVIGGVLLSFVLDWIKGVDWLSTLKTVVDCIVKAIVAFLNFELKVWWVLVAIALLLIALAIYSKVLDAKEKDKPIPFLDYTSDFILDYSWEWDYEKTSDGKYTIAHLHPVCSNCGMTLKQDGRYGTQVRCLRCNTKMQWDNSYLYDANLLIEDNIKKKYLQSQK